MNIIVENFHASFFTAGALTPAVLHLFLAFLFLKSLPERSRSSLHLGLMFLLLALFNFGYFIAAGFDLPLAACHRWITVGTILAGQAHFNMFVLYLREESRPRFGRLFLFAQYAFALAVFAVFFFATIGAEKIYHFDGHYWDFNADAISRVIGIIILLFVLMGVGLTYWKYSTIKLEARRPILMMGIAYLLGTLAPSITNILSRTGHLDREIYQVTWNLFTIVGFFLLAVLYINFTRDRTSFMAKITGISLVTLLTVFQLMSFFSFQDQERSYDEIRSAHARLFAERRRAPEGALKSSLNSASNGGPEEALYLIAFSPGDDAARVIFASAERYRNIDLNRFKDDYRKAARAARADARPSTTAHANEASKRHYRRNGQDRFISYIHLDEMTGAVYEVGFPYLHYRQHMHGLGLELLVMLTFIMIVVLVGFRFFFQDALEKPLNKLMEGLWEVGAGNLDIELPVKVEDEIGYLARNFNNMVRTIRETKQEVDERARNLEQKVAERTRDIEMLNEISRKMNATLDLDEILAQMLELVGELRGIEGAVLGIASEDNRYLAVHQPEGALGFAREQFAALAGRDIPFDEEGSHILRARLRKRPVHVPNVETAPGGKSDRMIVDAFKIKSYLLLPLAVRERVTGVLWLANRRRELELSEEGIANISRIADQIAGAVHASALFQEIRQTRLETEKSRNEIKELYEFSKELHSRVELDAMLDLFFARLEKEFGLEHFGLMMVDEQKRALKVKAAKLPPDLPPEMARFTRSFIAPLNRNAGVFYLAYSRAQPLYFPDVTEILKYADGNEQQMMNQFMTVLLQMKSLLLVPLVLRGQVIGIVAAANRLKEARLSTEDIAAVSRLCEQITGALQSSLLLEEVRAEREKTERLLFNMLPARTARELKASGRVEPVPYDSITILASNFPGFEALAEDMLPEKLIGELHRIFLVFEQICARYSVEKIRTAGDAFIGAGGVPEINFTHPIDVCLAALDMREFLARPDKDRRSSSGFRLPRLGIHTGTASRA